MASWVSLTVQQLDRATDKRGHPDATQGLPAAIPRELPPHGECPLQFGSLAGPEQMHVTL